MDEAARQNNAAGLGGWRQRLGGAGAGMLVGVTIALQSAVHGGWRVVRRGGVSPAAAVGSGRRWWGGRLRPVTLCESI